MNSTSSRHSGVKVAHDPESNMKLGAGVAPVPAMLRRGIDVGLGTDGCASNNNLDLFGEMGMCAKLHKVFSADPTVLPAEKVVEMATIGGARVLGMADRIGSIAPGKWADIILVDMKKPHLTPLYHPFSQLVYAASGADVSTSIIGGQDRHEESPPSHPRSECGHGRGPQNRRGDRSRLSPAGACVVIVYGFDVTSETLLERISLST